jgi:hypothetical protein
MFRTSLSYGEMFTDATEERAASVFRTEKSMERWHVWSRYREINRDVSTFTLVPTLYLKAG